MLVMVMTMMTMMMMMMMVMMMMITMTKTIMILPSFYGELTCTDGQVTPPSPPSRCPVSPGQVVRFLETLVGMENLAIDEVLIREVRLLGTSIYPLKLIITWRREVRFLGGTAY